MSLDWTCDLLFTRECGRSDIIRVLEQRAQEKFQPLVLVLENFKKPCCKKSNKAYLRTRGLKRSQGLSQQLAPPSRCVSEARLDPPTSLALRSFQLHDELRKDQEENCPHCQGTEL